MMELEELRPLLEIIHRRERGELNRDIARSLGFEKNGEAYTSHIFRALKMLGVQVGKPRRVVVGMPEAEEFRAWKSSQAASSPSAAE